MVALPEMVVSVTAPVREPGNLLVSDENLKPIDDLSKRYRLVFLPVVDSCSRFDKHDEVLVLALEMDFGDSLVALHLV